ncbi:hypothetical protein BDN72DRAFT_849507 [Pluteus cervinus]|uniref:Uncharacterized protein n=1 Tax=Pluteus cervinus TaxID=181527 RepID=A0ACD3A7G7_9AGAR|nr:hypothetical protein BDN72DRAFT_849507 [Pluteus cervinus]
MSIPQESIEPITISDRSDLNHDDAEILCPRLPPEIEFEIFRLAFEWRKKDRVLNLLCVAKRVRDWLIPVIYGALVFKAHNLEGPALSSLQRYGHHVRHVLYMRDPKPIKESDISKYCPNISSLCFWGGGSVTEDLLDLTVLKTLVSRNLDFFQTKVNDEVTPHAVPSTQTDIRRTTWCSNITHLSVSNIRTARSSLPLLQFSNLTHLMLLSSTPLAFLQQILRSRPSLKVLIWLLVAVRQQGKVSVVELHSEGAPRIDDKRVVAIDGAFSDDWLMTAAGEREEDMWALATRTVEERNGKGNMGL